MSSKDVFVPLEVQAHTSAFIKKTNRETVIKGEDLVVGKPIKVGGLKTISKQDVDEQIEPIIKGEDIVGVRYHCTCGESVEIQFEFEAQVAPVDALKTVKKDN